VAGAGAVKDGDRANFGNGEKLLNPYEDTEYLSKRWEYSDLEKLYQELNNLIHSRRSGDTFARGLVFKPIGNYSTLAGAYSGHPSWIMVVSYKKCEITLAARQPEVVLQKALYWFSTCFVTDDEPGESFMAGEGWKAEEDRGPIGL
jgi:hypothetical protein